MVDRNEISTVCRIPGHRTVRVLLPESVWLEYETIAKKYILRIDDFLVQAVFWTSAPYRSGSIPINNLVSIEMPGRSADGFRPFDLRIADLVFDEIEDLGRIHRIEIRELITQFLLHTVFDGPLSGSLQKLTGEDRVRRQPSWKADLRQSLRKEGV